APDPFHSRHPGQAEIEEQDIAEQGFRPGEEALAVAERARATESRRPVDQGREALANRFVVLDQDDVDLRRLPSRSLFESSHHADRLADRTSKAHRRSLTRR